MPRKILRRPKSSRANAYHHLSFAYDDSTQSRNNSEDSSIANFTNYPRIHSSNSLSFNSSLPQSFSDQQELSSVINDAILPDIIPPYTTSYGAFEDLCQRMTVSSANSRAVTMTTSSLSSPSSQISLPSVVQPVSEILRTPPLAAISANDVSNYNANGQGNSFTQPFPQMLPPSLDYFPRAPRLLNAISDHPLYQYFNTVTDLSQPTNSWLQDNRMLLQTVITELENANHNYMVFSFSITRILSAIIDRARHDQTFDNDFLDSLQVSSEQFLQNAIAHYNANLASIHAFIPTQQNHQ
ncbi:hypothetical protein WUBG_01801 [Wuchereria bancrofti]|uniref:Uncharacterized protein n=1 Tax=Wuchereria bancrofti TaxID=6293 RepID=J9EXF5_WUCBA|nr:hypothetical protein WUBG_01801 [Wuchereria bancrofti]VDM09000.1 unnamed protein product [Wuchereria bancrofti]